MAGKKDWAGKVENSTVSPGTSAVSELYWHEESESKHLEKGVRGRGSGLAGVVAGPELGESGVRAREPSRAGDQSLCEVGSASRWRKVSSVGFPCLEVVQHRGQGPGRVKRQPTRGESPGRGLGTREGCLRGRKVWHGVPTPSGVKRTFVCMCSAWEVRD